MPMPPGTLDDVVSAFNAFELDRAETLVERYEKVNGVGRWSRYYRVRIATLQGDLENAKRWADSCVEQAPEASICREARGETALVRLVVEGNVFKQLGAAIQARRELVKAVGLDPDNLRARLLLVRFYSLAPWLAGGSKARARQQVRACEERDQFWGHEARALLALSERNYATAIDEFTAARSLRPDDRDPAYYLARAYAENDQPDAAIAVLEELVERYPRFYDAWLELGRLAAARGTPSPRGIAALEHYLASAGDARPQQRARAAEALSSLYRAAGREADAVKALRVALDTRRASRSAADAMRELCAGPGQIRGCEPVTADP